MKLIKYSCRNFRNIENCNVDFDPYINVFIGKNGQGKTNLLESIYYVSTTRSFRVNSDQNLIRFNEPFSKIECFIEDDQIKKKLGCVIHEKGKTCFLQNQQIPRTSEFIGTLNAILFVPSDLELFTSSPKVRRKMMDIEIGKIDSSYNFILSKYNKLLKERNSALKMNQNSEDLFDVIDKQLAQCQIEIGKKRKEFIEFINQRITLNYQKISNDDIKIDCLIKSIFEKDRFDENEIYEKLKSSRQKDFILKNTSYGIHRDDIEFFMNDSLLDSVASQGQRRMVILSLKLTFIDYVLAKTKKEPVLLLDDVLSELDIDKRKNLFNVLPSTIQTFITTTDLDVLEELPKKPAIYKMINGHLEKGD